jgi:hypothetical protein
VKFTLCSRGSFKTSNSLRGIVDGERSIKVVKGGLAIQGGCGADAQGQIIMANAAAIVYLDVGDYLAFKRGQHADTFPAEPSDADKFAALPKL